MSGPIDEPLDDEFDAEELAEANGVPVPGLELHEFHEVSEISPDIWASLSAFTEEALGLEDEAALREALRVVRDAIALFRQTRH